MKNAFSKEFLFYLLKFVGIFLFLYFGTLAIIGLSSKGNSYNAFVADYLNFITPLRHSLLKGCELLLQLLGYNTSRDDQIIAIAGTPGVRLVYSCVGYGVLSFWTAFVLANHGSLAKKLRWVLIGWAVLWSINVLRIFLLVLAVSKNQDLTLGLDHHTFFNIAAYGCIFLMIYFYDRDKSKGYKSILQP